MTARQATGRLAPAWERSRWLPTVAASAVSVIGLAVGLPPHLPPQWRGPAASLAFAGVAWMAFAVGAWLVCRLPRRRALAFIVIGGLGLTVAAGFGPPRSSDDVYRYIWDGRVQAAGINPYQHVPAAAELVGLRDPYLWPQHSAWCVPVSEAGPEAEGRAEGTSAPSGAQRLVSGCTLINRPAVHTIYPPFAEAIFIAAYLISPSGGYTPMRLVGAGFAMATTILLIVGLGRAGHDPRRAVLWAWCPTVALEAVNNAHIDVVAAFLTGLSLLLLAAARTRRTSALGGAVMGLAIATKLTPALITPALLRRRPVTVALAATAALATVYLPHLFTVGGAVIGFLPGYLSEEGFRDGSRFALLTALVPQSWARPLAAVILAGVAVLVTLTADPDRPWQSATIMTGTALLVAAPSYPWYAMLLVVLVALGGRAPWLAAAAAAYPAQYAHDLGYLTVSGQRLGYTVAALVVALAWLAARRRSHHAWSGRATLPE